MGQGLEVEPDDLRKAAKDYVQQSAAAKSFSSTFASGAHLTPSDFGNTAETAKEAAKYNAVYDQVLQQLQTAVENLAGFGASLAGAARNYEAMERANTVTVKPGDTLWDIAKKKLGDPARYPEIAKNNPQIKDPDLIHPGDKIEVRPTEDLKLPWPPKS